MGDNLKSLNVCIHSAQKEKQEMSEKENIKKLKKKVRSLEKELLTFKHIASELNRRLEYLESLEQER